MLTVIYKNFTAVSKECHPSTGLLRILFLFLFLFLVDGRIEIDNDTVELTIRPIALNRKNVPFSGQETGAQNWAIFASIINGYGQNQIEQLLTLS
jgi:hypothetical protein